jgi:peptide/nickel transport system substrate-binding protein/oligopeptide transport system substrate-binding protein
LVKAPANKQIYTVPEVNVSDFDTLDPALASDTVSISAIQMIYTGLVQLNSELQIEPQLAQSWEQSADGLSWTFHLRTGLKFNDGKPLTSSDVAYSINRALQPATRSTVAPLYLGLIKDANLLLAGRIPTLIGNSILIPDQNTIVLVTSKRSGYFLAMLTMPCSYVVEKSLIDQYGAQFTDHLAEGGGSGPFKVGQYIHGQQIDFFPNANYYLGHPQLQRVSFVFYNSPDESYQAYQSNKVDMTEVPQATLKRDQTRKDFHQVAQLWTNYYAMNYRSKPFDNIHIRQAFALAIDKVAISREVWQGTVIPTNHIIPLGMPGYNAQLTGPDGTQNLKGNASKAQALLQQGLAEEKLTALPAITLSYALDVPHLKNEIDSLLQMWKKVLDVTVTADGISYSTLLDKVTGTTNNDKGLQLWALSWVGEYPDPQDWLSLQFGRGEAYNNVNYGQNASSTAVQELSTQQLLEAADAMGQGQNRLQAYQKAEQQIVNDVGWIPLGQVTSSFLRTTQIVGIQDNGQRIIAPEDWAKIYRVQIEVV